MKTLYEVEVWMQPEHRCWMRLTLACGSVWLLPLKAIIDLTQPYYEEEGWDDEADLAEGEKQPTGAELRGLMLANISAEQWARELHWRKLKPFAKRISGQGEPPYDLLWAADEQGGKFDLVTTLTPSEQKRSRYVLWSETNPEKWAPA